MVNADQGENDVTRDRAIRLFTYLKELCALRSTQVRNVTTYDQVFWFDDLPHDKLCQCIAWCGEDSRQDGKDRNPDLWIEVRKPQLRSPPELPDEVEPWISEKQLHDSSSREPLIFDEIPRATFLGNAQDVDTNEKESLNEHPEVFEAWVTYLETQWKPWADEDRKLQKVQKVYNQLFNTYQRQEKLGEQYEVIIGIGLLNWRSPRSGEIRRHVVTLQSRIDFDRVRGIMSAGPAPDGAQPVLEYDMLETSDRPTPNTLIAIKNDVVALDGDPWNPTALELVLRGFVNAIPNPGEFLAILNPNEAGTGAGARINLAPALILRKRTRRTFEDFYRQIIEQTADGGIIP